MSESQKKFYITTPIYYVNARPHIGHAYSTIVADVIARRHRLLGDDVFFLTGTDEHGQKIERSAAAAGIPPQQFADQVSETFRSLWKRMGITNDDFIRTTEPRHKQGVQKLFEVLRDKGFIDLDTYTGQYCVSDEAYVEVGPGEPCPECGRITETISESNYYFRLSAFQDKLIEKIESNELLIQPDSRRNEVLSFVKSGLKNLSVSRTSFKWGIPVPDDEGHVIYVWLDALINYMTAVGYGSDKPEDIAQFQRYWPADLHLVGKEIIRFHSVYWPAFLMAADLPLPKSIVANGWLLFDESKMSKSKGNVVRTETILDAFGSLKPELSKTEKDLFATDVLRYFLLREIPFGQDGSFSFDALVTRYNADLANSYGNLVSRTLSMIQMYLNDIIPDPGGRGLQQIVLKRSTEFEGGWFEVANCQLSRDSFAAVTFYALAFRQFRFSLPSNLPLNEVGLAGVVDSAMFIAQRADEYIAANAPWKLAKDPSKYQDLAEVLYDAAEAIRILTALLYPILPHTTAQVWKQLGFTKTIEEAAKNGELKDLKWGGLKPGTKLGPLSPIFPRADKGLIQTMIDTEAANAQAVAPKSTLILEENPTAVENHAPSDPAAGPRTASLPSENSGSHVAASAAITTERHGTPPHGEAAASGVFANSTTGSASPDTPQIAIDDFVKIDLRVSRRSSSPSGYRRRTSCCGLRSTLDTKSARYFPASPSGTHRKSWSGGGSS